ncbi:MAG: acyl-CoA/acyl-ACP dehydrogenase [Armatimonadetes bacterium]|nr:acyl-CoA/acyl-ACP dehydrogenase [Armatimonadota bacterium]
MVNEQILREARRLADEVFRPHAQEADQGEVTGQVGQNVRMLADAGYFGLGISPEFGGMGADDATRREFTELMASACGVTGFTQQQLHAGGGFVGGAPSQELRREKLPLFAAGKELCGVAFSHLRRPGAPMVRAERVSGGFQISGTAPWVTGWTLLDSFILGATLPNGAHLFAYIPKAGNEAAMSGGPHIPLAVMNASDTVEVTMTNLFVPQDHVLSERPADALRRGDFCGITGHVFLPLGCARGSVHYLRQLAEKRGDDQFTRAADDFTCEIDACRHEALTWSGACADLPDYKEHALQARATAILLAVRAAHAAVAATGGSAHRLDSPPQRLLREAIFYTTIAQTSDVRSATLDLLTSPDCWQAP